MNLLLLRIFMESIVSLGVQQICIQCWRTTTIRTWNDYRNCQHNLVEHCTHSENSSCVFGTVNLWEHHHHIVIRKYKNAVHIQLTATLWHAC